MSHRSRGLNEHSCRRVEPFTAHIPVPERRSPRPRGRRKLFLPSAFLRLAGLPTADEGPQQTDRHGDEPKNNPDQPEQNPDQPLRRYPPPPHEDPVGESMRGPLRSSHGPGRPGWDHRRRTGPGAGRSHRWGAGRGSRGWPRRDRRDRWDLHPFVGAPFHLGHLRIVVPIRLHERDGVAAIWVRTELRRLRFERGPAPPALRTWSRIVGRSAVPSTHPPVLRPSHVLTLRSRRALWRPRGRLGRHLVTRRRRGWSMEDDILSCAAPEAGAGRPHQPPSSSGLGCRPFKAETRVRIPLGARTT